MPSLTRFSVKPLSTMTRRLAAVASGGADSDLVIRGARVLSTYSERVLPDREIWLTGGRIAAVKPSGTYKGSAARIHDARGGIVAPGLVDPHIHIESSMVTACAYAEAALLNGTTTIFCDSHEIGNVMDVAGVEAMLEDARQAPLSIFLTVPSTVPATSALLETAGGDLTAAKIAALFDKWPEAASHSGKEMDFVQVAMGDERAAMPFSRHRCNAVVRFRDMSTVANSSRPMLHLASPIPMRRSIARSPTTCWKPAFGCSCAVDRRPRHGTACRRRSRPSLNLALPTSASRYARTTAMPTISCYSGWTG